MEKSVIVHCRIKIILQIIFISRSFTVSLTLRGPSLMVCGINGGIRSVTVGAHLASRSARYSISCLSSSLMFSESSGIYLSFLMAFIFLICESAIVFFSTSAVNIYAKLTL